MASTSEIKNGLCINFNNDIYKIIEFLHVKPGKGPAFVRTKMKSLKHGKVIDNTFPSGHNIDIVRVETRDFQFLYKDDMGYNFMNSETFEQITVPESMISNTQFLKDGLEVMVSTNTENEEVLTVDLPQYVNYKVTYTEPGFKGNTTSSSVTKPAVIETGANVNVPLFVEVDNLIKIDTTNGNYVERVKEQ